MINIKYNKRIFALISGLLASMICGMLLYAFSVLIIPLNSHFKCSHSQITLAFSICCLLSCLTCFPAGKLTDRIGPRAVTIFGAVLTAFGFFLSAFATSIFYFYITYGVISGIGSGFLYLPPLCTAPKWWPHKQFFATGFAVVGLGIGSFFMGPLATWIIINFGWEKVFVWCSGLFFVMGIIAGFLIENPVVHIYEREILSKDNKLSHQKTIRTLQFWLLYIAFFCGETGGLTVMSQMVPYAAGKGFSIMKGAYLVSIFSVANGCSRLISGLIAEKLNLKKYFAFVLGMQVVAIFSMFYIENTFFILSCFIFMVGWSFGTMAVLFPSITISFFGEEYHASNYGFLLTACAFAGVVGPLMGGLSKDIKGDYTISLVISTILSLVACIILFSIRPPKV